MIVLALLMLAAYAMLLPPEFVCFSVRIAARSAWPEKSVLEPSFLIAGASAKVSVMLVLVVAVGDRYTAPSGVASMVILVGVRR